VGAVTNLILDPILIFDLLGCPALGVRGATIATVIGQCVSAVVAIWLNKVKNPAVPVRFRGYRPKGSVIWNIYKVGFPTIATQAVGSVMVAAVNWILLPFSTTEVAFFGAYYKLQNFLFMPMNGLGQTLIPIVGYSYGAKNFSRIKSSLRTALPIAVRIALTATGRNRSIPRHFMTHLSSAPPCSSIFCTLLSKSEVIFCVLLKASYSVSAF
jgi:Na+-driven multidrug efflux pump